MSKRNNEVIDLCSEEEDIQESKPIALKRTNEDDANIGAKSTYRGMSPGSKDARGDGGGAFVQAFNSTASGFAGSAAPIDVLSDAAASRKQAQRTLIYCFDVAGVPQTKHRARVGKYGQWYNPNQKKEKAFRDSVAAKIYLQHGLVKPIARETPIAVALFFQYGRNAFHLQSAPDIDNLTKFVLDSLNQVLYQDDRQVVEVFAQKGVSSGTESLTHVEIYAASVPELNIVV